MKRYTDLTIAEQNAVLDQEFKSILEGLIEVGEDFLPEYLHPNFQRAVEAMETLQTPWFLGEELLSDEAIRDNLWEQTREWVEGAYFMEPGEYAVQLPIIRSK